MDSRTAILLTGTINPNNMTFTKLQEPEVRKKQYIDSLKFWLKTTQLPIVFVENSNNDLSAIFLKEIEKKRIEILTFNGNNFNKDLGKGYGELECLEYALTNSILLQNAEFIFKVTGRYKVLNFSVFLDSYLSSLETQLLVDFKWNLSFCDSRFFGFTTPFIKEYLLSYKNLIDDSKGIYFEHILSKACLHAIANNYKFEPFKTLPRIEGYSASSGAKYNTNYIHWLRYKFKYDIKYKSFKLGNLPWI